MFARLRYSGRRLCRHYVRPCRIQGQDVGQVHVVVLHRGSDLGHWVHPGCSPVCGSWSNHHLVLYNVSDWAFSNNITSIPVISFISQKKKLRENVKKLCSNRAGLCTIVVCTKLANILLLLRSYLYFTCIHFIFKVYCNNYNHYNSILYFCWWTDYRPEKKNKIRCACLTGKATCRLVLHHMGSVAFGAFIITLVKLPRYILMYIHQK